MAYENDQSLYYAKQVPMEELVTYAGFTPVRRGSVFILKEHDSFVIFPKTNSFCHYSRAKGDGYVGGSPIDFCMEYMEMDFKEALTYLCEMAGYKPEKSERPNNGGHTYKKRSEREEQLGSMLSGMQVNLKPKFGLNVDEVGNAHKADRVQMKLPEKNQDNRRVFAYLTRTRGIDPDVVKAFLDSGRLYESADYHNCVFVTYDENGYPAYAFQRGTSSYKPYKKDVYGSDKITGFPVYRQGSKNVIVFEAPIDMMSFLSMYEDDKSSMIALGCLSPKGLYRFLTQHAEIESVTLLLDNDEPAKKAIAGIAETLTKHGYAVGSHELRINMQAFDVKDVNEYLVNVHNPALEKMKIAR